MPKCPTFPAVLGRFGQWKRRANTRLWDKSNPAIYSLAMAADGVGGNPGTAATTKQIEWLGVGQIGWLEIGRNLSTALLVGGAAVFSSILLENAKITAQAYIVLFQSLHRVESRRGNVGPPFRTAQRFATWSCCC